MHQAPLVQGWPMPALSRQVTLSPISPPSLRTDPSHSLTLISSSPNAARQIYSRPRIAGWANLVTAPVQVSRRWMSIPHPGRIHSKQRMQWPQKPLLANGLLTSKAVSVTRDTDSLTGSWLKWTVDLWKSPFTSQIKEHKDSNKGKGNHFSFALSGTDFTFSSKHSSARLSLPRSDEDTWLGGAIYFLALLFQQQW